MSDTRPFPIQGMRKLKDVDGKRIRIVHSPCTIPWWLAEAVYKVYSSKYGTSQSLERLAERGGFGREEVLMFLREQS